MRRADRAIAYFGHRRSIKRFRWTKLKRSTIRIYSAVHVYINGVRLTEVSDVRFEWRRRPRSKDTT